MTVNEKRDYSRYNVKYIDKYGLIFRNFVLRCVAGDWIWRSSSANSVVVFWTYGTLSKIGLDRFVQKRFNTFDLNFDYIN